MSKLKWIRVLRVCVERQYMSAGLMIIRYNMCWASVYFLIRKRHGLVL